MNRLEHGLFEEIQKDLVHMRNAHPENERQLYIQQGIIGYLEKLIESRLKKERENTLGKTIYLENPAGETVMIIQISEQGDLIRMDNCEVADIDTNEMRIQQIREVK